MKNLRTYAFLVGLSVCEMIVATPAEAAAASNAQPFGIVIGTTTCAQASKILGGDVAKKPDDEGVVQVEARDPGSFYPGSSSIKAQCFAGDQPVIWLGMTVSKGGLGNPGGQEAYRNLAGKYKRVAGGAIPSLGDGYARFSSGDSIIELNSPHLSFDFNLYYLTAELYNKIISRNHEKEQQDAAKKRSL